MVASVLLLVSYSSQRPSKSVLLWSARPNRRLSWVRPRPSLCTCGRTWPSEACTQGVHSQGSACSLSCCHNSQPLLVEGQWDTYKVLQVMSWKPNFLAPSTSYSETITSTRTQIAPPPHTHILIHLQPWFRKIEMMTKLTH